MSDLRYSCILFDLDGTVIDTVSDCAAAINRTMKSFGFPLHTEDEVRSYLNNGARRLIKCAVPESCRTDEKLIDRVLAEYIDNYSEECVKSSVIYPGISDLLSELHLRGAALGVVTNKPDVQTKIMIPHYFGGIFGYYEGNSDSAPTKPDGVRVEMALCALNKKKEQTLFVGDSWVDVETAKNGGVPCIGVAWGFGGIDGFGSHALAPDYIAVKPQEILDIAEKGFPKHSHIKI